MTDDVNGKQDEVRPEQIAELRKSLEAKYKDLEEQHAVLKSFLDFQKELKGEGEEETVVEEEVEEKDLDPALEEAARLQAEEREEFLESMFAASGGDVNALNLEPSEKELKQREILKRAQAKRVAELEAKDAKNRESLERFAADLLEDQLRRDDGGQVKKRLVESAAHHEQLAKELGPTIEAGVEERKKVMQALEEERVKKARRAERTTYHF